MCEVHKPEKWSPEDDILSDAITRQTGVCPFDQIRVGGKCWVNVDSAWLQCIKLPEIKHPSGRGTLVNAIVIQNSVQQGELICVHGALEVVDIDAVENEPKLVETTFGELNVGDEFYSGEARFRKTGPTQAVEYLPRTGGEYDLGQIDIAGRPWPVKKVVRKGT